MTTPETAVALQAAAMRGFRTLEDVIDVIPAKVRDRPFPVAATAPAASGVAGAPRDRDLQDVLNHLHAWHELLIGWLDAIEAGRTPAYPAEGYDWGRLDALNLALREKYRVRQASRAFARLQASHATALGRVSALGDDVLFDADRFDWLGGTLAGPAHECLGGHYAWAVQAIAARFD
ncbi:ClbS/DfsB family four-helix bundle protein [Agromyces endophyticus]|uniref:ClbS/DfsB family four-helix bundle protein n=1 Tax=Agromyces sp. H17E-10 TaxID=2932244 RepID=UPI001FD41321|nr:ClbS/DfsB family four-helix bundle protein [Agromyces sp. H17E-10]UOQ88675.1 ClbS/DfsB family four-helix bundle protein [Agromyces sp. H17E-10]